MEGTGIIIIIHLQISMVLFYDFLMLLIPNPCLPLSDLWDIGSPSGLYTGVFWQELMSMIIRKGEFSFFCTVSSIKRVWNILC